MKRLKIRFVDPETRCLIEDLYNIIMDYDNGSLIAHYVVYDGEEIITNKEVEIQVIE